MSDRNNIYNTTALLDLWIKTEYPWYISYVTTMFVIPTEQDCINIITTARMTGDYIGNFFGKDLNITINELEKNNCI